MSELVKEKLKAELKKKPYRTTYISKEEGGWLAVVDMVEEDESFDEDMLGVYKVKLDNNGNVLAWIRQGYKPLKEQKLIHKEHIIGIVIFAIALSIMVIGFKAHTGYYLLQPKLDVKLFSNEYYPGQIIDGNIKLSIDSLASDAIMVVSLENKVHAVNIKEILDELEVDYGISEHDIGGNEISIITLEKEVIIPLSAFKMRAPYVAGKHALSVEISNSAIEDDAVLGIVS